MGGILKCLDRENRLASRTLYENSFAVVGPLLWNTLPDKVNRRGTHNAFQCKLIHYMRRLTDEPPVWGYSRNHKNSPVEEG